MTFKERLREKRQEAGLTQAELAKKVSVTARTIQNYELGTRKPQTMKIVSVLAVRSRPRQTTFLGIAEDLCCRGTRKGWQESGQRY